MARTGLAWDTRFELHKTGPNHPERPERVRAIASALRACGIDQTCIPIEVVSVDPVAISRVHSDTYVRRLTEACLQGCAFIDVPDSAICPQSFEIACLAAGAAVQAVGDVMAGTIDNAFCVIRPPGHHAEHDLSMGFCLLNNVAIAAMHLLEEHGFTRVLILDWDVHHCNATQHTFESDPRVLVISLHGHPGVVYPGTGYENERGKGDGEGYTINIPMLPESGDDDYHRAFDDRVLPAIDEFKPQFVLLSAGFDAHRLEPLAPLNLETSSYGWMTDAVMEVAKRHCGGNLVSLLEGGYHLDALSDSVVLHVARLLQG